LTWFDRAEEGTHSHSIDYESLKDRLCNVSTVLIYHLENLIGVEKTFHFLLCLFFLLLIPVPFVDLTCLKASHLCQVLHEAPVPVSVFDIFFLKYLDLFFIFPSPFFFVFFRLLIFNLSFFYFCSFILRWLWFLNPLRNKWLVNELQVNHQFIGFDFLLGIENLNFDIRTGWRRRILCWSWSIIWVMR